MQLYSKHATRRRCLTCDRRRAYVGSLASSALKGAAYHVLLHARVNRRACTLGCEVGSLANRGYFGLRFVVGTGKAAKMMQNPAAERNKGPILEVLKKYLPRDFRGKAMDMSAGIGVHVACFASYFASIEWLPTEFDRGLFNSIRAKVAQHKLQNVLDPRMVDTREPVQAWAEGTLQQSCFDVIISVNVIHISPWTATEGLFAGAGQLLRPGGYLFTYGPYSENGVIFPESNVRFDQSLKLKDPDWGIRDISRVQIVAENNGLSLLDKVDCPANNKVLVFQKAGHLNI